MDVFFEFVISGVIKVRIMFTDNRFLAKNLEKRHHDYRYHLLYYQFIKHAFGLKYFISDYPVLLEFFFDDIPDNKIINAQFKKFIFGLQFLPDFQNSNFVIKENSIYEVDSKKHVLMQCLDVVLGSMAFRLNNMHKEKPPGSKKRGKRTIAKEVLYKHINQKIRQVRPYFNIGITTGTDGDYSNRFHHHYRHWLFTPKVSDYIPRNNCL
jgi:hypothetical protein